MFAQDAKFHGETFAEPGRASRTPLPQSRGGGIFREDAPMQTLTRRGLSAGLLATLPLPAAGAGGFRQVVGNSPESGDRLPDHAALWSRMPLPFTPAEAWRLLSPAVQAELGAAVIGMALAEYVSGQLHEDEADWFLDPDLREAAYDTSGDILTKLTPRLWSLFPDLYGPDGDHPAWALAGGLAR